MVIYNAKFVTHKKSTPILRDTYIDNNTSSPSCNEKNTSMHRNI